MCFVMLLLVPIGYAYKRRVVFLFAAASWPVLLPVMLSVYKMKLLPAAVMLLSFNALLAGGAIYRNITDKVKWGYAKKLKDKEEELKKLSVLITGLGIDENRVLEKELAVVKLYEMTKRMSGALKFEEILSIFGEILRDNFNFRRGVLVLLRNTDNNIDVEKIYNIPAADAALADEDGGIDYGYLIKTLPESRKACFFDRSSDAEIMGKIASGRDIKTMAIIPLASENRTMGAVVMEDMRREELDKSAIVAMQFALEVKKVFLYEKVEELAITDGLTGLFVRRYFMDRFEEELKRSKRYGFNFAFLMVDIDNFKKCNDTYGHLVGDVVLRDVGKIIKEHVREIDLVGRFGGEEFSIVFPETTRDGALMAAERLRKNVEANIFKAYDEKLKLTVSIGVAIYPKDSDNAKELIDKADEAMYAAKKSGKNIVCEYRK